MLGERGSSHVPGQVYVGTMRDWHLPVAEWQRYARTPVRRDYGAPGLRYTGTHDCRGIYGAPGLRCAGSPVHWRPRLPWRLRCAGTTVRRDYGTLAPTIAVRVRCAGTTVRRDYGAPRPAVPPARASGAPLPRTAWNNERRRPPWSSDRSLDPSRLGAERPPREFHLGSWIYPDPPLPTSDRL